MLYFVEDIPFKDISMPAIVLTVFKMDIIEFQSRLHGHWSILQNIVKRTLDVVFSS